jgi:gliding motility-associated-like protein
VEAANAFSPNNDGINEVWIINGIEEYPQNKVQIFNRWGDLVFEMQNYDNTLNFFDGSANKLNAVGANKLPEGTYFFKIAIQGPHKLKKPEGFLILKR